MIRLVRPALIAMVLVASACGGDDAEPAASSSQGTAATTTTTTLAGIAAGSVMISISTDGGKVGGPTLVTVTVSNGADHPVTLVRPRWIPNFVRFTVLDSAGDPMPFYGPQVQLRPLGDEGFVLLGPGLSTSEILDLGPGYQLDAGTYTVSAEYRNPEGGSHEGGRALGFEHGEGPVSASIELVVVP